MICKIKCSVDIFLFAMSSCACTAYFLTPFVQNALPCYLVLCNIQIKFSTHRSFKGIHLTSKCLNLASIVIGFLLGHSQSIVISGCSFSQISKLPITVTNRTEISGSENLESDLV